MVIISAIGLAVGIGGAALMSIQLGRGDERSAQGVFSQSMVFLCGLLIVLITFLLIGVEGMISAMGASGTLAQGAAGYLPVMAPFFLFQATGLGLSVFIRNDTNPVLTMIGMIGSIVVNVTLDYLFIFVFKWGIQGAALATGLAQVAMFAILLTHFRSGGGH